jgi:hypothetical protein
MFAGEVDLNNWYKPKIDKKILKDLSKRSDAKGIVDISIFCIALLFSGYLMGYLVVYSSFIALW